MSFSPRASGGSILDLCSFRNSKFQKKQIGFCSKCHCFVESSAYWTRLYIITSILNMLRYNNVINIFPPRASSGSILDLCSFRNSKFQKSKLDSALKELFCGIKCTLDTSVHYNFYSQYVALL